MSEQTTLRDTLEGAVEALETPEVQPVVEAAPETPPETAEQKAERIRDEKGRFAPKSEAPKQEATSESAPAAPAPEPRKPPSSWKKDYWEAYQKLDPQVADYIAQREQQFASGVSTYKQEAERSREILEALAPFQQDMQQHGIRPSQVIGSLAAAHQRLVKGSDVEKLQMMSKMASDYRIPARLAVQGPDGQWQLLDERQLPAPVPQAPMAPDVDRIVDAKLQEREMMREIEAMKSNAEKYPHFEQVRDTMAGLLQSGLADNLSNAYEAAIRLPLHADIWEAQQQQQRQQEEAARVEAEKKRVSEARGKAVSPKSATPTGMGAAPKQGLRDILAAEVEARLGGGRV